MTPFIRRVLPDEDDDLFQEDEDEEDDGWEGDEDDEDEDGEEEETWQVRADGLGAPTRGGRQFA
jgi:hypothetical protein